MPRAERAEARKNYMERRELGMSEYERKCSGPEYLAGAQVVGQLPVVRVNPEIAS